MRKVLWIALREFLAIVWTKAFLFGLLFLPLMIGLIAIVINLMGNDDFRAAGRIALIDPTGRVTMANDAAASLLGLEEDADVVGLPVRDLGLDPHVTTELVADGEASDVVVVTGERVLVLNRRTASSRGQGVGSVTTMRDRTDLVEVQRQLGSNLSITDALRAQTHEFANQLHTISGLIQIGDYDEVVSYVDALTEGRAAVDLTVARRVRDSSVAALLVAKSAVAAERKVALRVTAQTHLDPLEPSCSYDVATVLGNLISNGIDAAVKANNLDALLFPGPASAGIASKPGYPTVLVPFGMLPNPATGGGRGGPGRGGRGAAPAGAPGQPPTAGRGATPPTETAPAGTPAPAPPPLELPPGFDPKPQPFGVGFTGPACSEPKLLPLAYLALQGLVADR